MKEIILVKNGELALKGLNRSSFEDILIKNMKRRLNDLGKFEFTKSQSTIMVDPIDDDIDLDDAVDVVSRVFGIALVRRIPRRRTSSPCPRYGLVRRSKAGTTDQRGRQSDSLQTHE